jgi:hypothetical protein
MNRSLFFLSDTNNMRPFRKKLARMIERLSDPPNHVQTLLRSEVALSGPAYFPQVLRELALREVFRELAPREVFRELALRVLSE